MLLLVNLGVELHLNHQNMNVAFAVKMFVFLVQVKGSDGAKGGRQRGVEEEGSLWRRTGWMDGWIARQGEEGGREGKWKEVKERKMVTRKEWGAVCMNVCIYVSVCVLKFNIRQNFYGLETGLRPLGTDILTHTHIELWLKVKSRTNKAQVI